MNKQSIKIDNSSDVILVEGDNNVINQFKLEDILTPILTELNELKKQIKDSENKRDCEHEIIHSSEIDKIKKLWKLQNELELQNKNWEYIINEIEKGEVNKEFQATIILYLKGDINNALSGTEDDEIFNSLDKLDEEIDNTIRFLIFKANIYEISGNSKKAFEIYFKIYERSPAKIEHYFKLLNHFFNNQLLQLFHIGFIEAMETSNYSYNYVTNNDEESLDRAIAYNNYNKILFYSEEYYLLTDDEKDKSIIEKISFVYDRDKIGIVRYLFSFFKDGYRFIRALNRGFDTLKSDFDTASDKYFKNKVFISEIVQKIGYYSYVALMNFHHGFYRVFTNDSLKKVLLEKHTDATTNFGFMKILGLSSSGVLMSLLSLIKDDFETGHKIIHDFTDILIETIRNQDLSLDRKKTLFWEYYFGQLTFIQFGLRTVTKEQELEILLSHCTLLFGIFEHIQHPLDFTHYSINIGSRALMLQAKTRIKLFRINRNIDQLKIAIDCLYLRVLKIEESTNMMHPYDYIFIKGYLIFLQLQSEFPKEVYDLTKDNKKSISSDDKQLVITLWNSLLENKKKQLISEFPDFDFSEFSN